jgi:hypothetical protein
MGHILSRNGPSDKPGTVQDPSESRMTEMITSDSMSGAGKRSDGLLG